MALQRPVRKKLNREEKALVTHKKLLSAAAQVIGELGYSATTIAKVTEIAGVAQGTFYNYFEDRQHLFNQVLPQVGHQMTDEITAAVKGKPDGASREVDRFRAYCDFLQRNPGFYRILYEAEVFAPKAHKKHMDYISNGYYRALKRSLAANQGTSLTDEETKAVVAMLLGARAYVAMRFIDDSTVPEHAITAYAKLIETSIFA